MFFNPIMMIILAGLSLLVGTIALIQTDSWLSVVPFAIFTVLFCLSLILPVPKPRKPLGQLTTARLSRGH